MQYSEYIAQDNARRDREIQLANQYNQQPESSRVKNLWMHSVVKQRQTDLSSKDIAGIIFGFIIAAAVLILSIWL